MTIFFYNADEPYGALSNFSRYGFMLDGLDWPTSEHYYQAQIPLASMLLVSLALSLVLALIRRLH